MHELFREFWLIIEDAHADKRQFVKDVTSFIKGDLGIDYDERGVLFDSERKKGYNSPSSVPRRVEIKRVQNGWVEIFDNGQKIEHRNLDSYGTAR